MGTETDIQTEQCLVTMIKFWRKALDNKCSVGAVLTALSKAFDSLNHKLLIVKLPTYGFENCVLGSICPSIHLSVYPSIHLSTYPRIHLSFYPSIHLSIYPSILLSIYPSIPLSLYPSSHLSL